MTPRVITVDKNAAYPKALTEMQIAGDLAASCELRQSNYLNNLVEQDHRFIKRLVKPAMGFFSDLTAWRTLQGYEAIHMMRKGQMQGVSKGDGLRQVAFVAELFAVVISIQQQNGEAFSWGFPRVFATQPAGGLLLLTSGREDVFSPALPKREGRCK